MKNQEKFLLLTLAAVQFTNILDFMIMMPLGPMLMRILKINPEGFSLVVSAYTFAAFTSSLVGSFWLDQVDRKKALLFNYILFLIATACCALAPNHIFLIIARVITGLFGGVMSAIVLSIIGDVIPADRRARAMGTVMASFSVASVVGVPLGLFFANKLGWHAPFYFIVIIGIFVVAGIYYFVPNMRGHLSNNTSSESTFTFIKNIWQIKSQYSAILMMAFLMLGQFAIIPFISPYLVKNVGLTEDHLPLVYGIGGGLTAITLPYIGYLADKFGQMKLFRITAVFSFIPLFCITHLPPLVLPIALFFTSLFFIGVTSRAVPAQALVTSLVPPQSRGKFMSIASSFQQLGAGVGAFIAGKIVFENQIHHLVNYNYVGYWAIATTILGLWMSTRLFSKT